MNLEVPREIPSDAIGRVLYAAKVFGQASILCGVLIWQVSRMIDALHAERAVSQAYNKTLTEELKQTAIQSAKGLTKSTAAIESQTRQSEEIVLVLRKSTHIMEQIERKLER